jgi:hypothetical protein
MTVFWIMLVALLAAVAYPLVHTWLRYRGTRIVRCPQTGGTAAIDLDARYAAASHASMGYPMLRVGTCSIWPRHQDCDQECLAQIE